MNTTSHTNAGQSSCPLPREKKLCAPATRSILLGSRPDLAQSVRTAFLCKNPKLLLKRRACENI